MKIVMAGGSDVGRQRSENQDRLYYHDERGFGIVADGIGGHRGGETAAMLAVNTIAEFFDKHPDPPAGEVPRLLVKAINQANQAILAHARANPQVAGMGTTANVVLFGQEKLYVGHIGDSRTYLYDDGHLWQLTMDHNVANFVERGWLKDDGGSSGQALVRALGLPVCEVDVYEVEYRPGQLFLTSSDGLFDMIDDEAIAALIQEHGADLGRLVENLIAAANHAGGADNITVLASRVCE